MSFTIEPGIGYGDMVSFYMTHYDLNDGAYSYKRREKITGKVTHVFEDRSFMVEDDKGMVYHQDYTSVTRERRRGYEV